MSTFSKKRSRTRRGRRAGRSTRGRRWALIGAMAGIVLLFGGGAMTAVRYIASQPLFDAQMTCYPDLVTHESAVFVDFSFTAGTSAAQDRSLRTGLRRAYDDLPPNGRVSVFTTARDTSAPMATPVFVACRPPANPAEQAQIGAPAKPPAYLERLSKEADAAYLEQIEQFMADAKDPEKLARDSPILEQLRAISKYPFAAPLGHLYVYTDGIQHTEKAWFCKISGHLPPFHRFREKPLYHRVKPAESFSGIDVTLWLVEFGRLPAPPDYPYCTNEELRVWWEAYFEAAGSTVDLIPLRYGAAG